MVDDIHFLKMRCQADVWYSSKELGQMLEPPTTGHHAAYVAKKSGLFLQRRNKGNNGCEYQIAKARFSPIKEAADTIEAQATRIEALEAALRETMSRCADCGGRGSFVKHDEVTDRDLWESCASCAVGYAALESKP